MSVGRSISIAFAALVIALTLSPSSAQATDIGIPEWGYDNVEVYPDQYVDVYPDQYVDVYPDQYVDVYPDQYSYDSGYGYSGGGSFGGGGFFSGGSKVGGGDVRVSNVNNNYNQNQNQNINNVHVNVGNDDDDDDDREDKKDKKKKKDRKVSYDYPVYHNPTPYVTLSQTPYTGLEMGPLGTALYWSFLVVWCLIAAYLVAIKKVHVGLAQRIKVALFGDDSTVTHPAYEVATPSVETPKSDIVELANALIDVIEGKSTRSYAVEAKKPAEDATDPFILAQINRTR